MITGAQLWLPGRTDLTAIAVQRGLILRVGTDAEVLELANSQTSSVDAGGRAVLPGFHDAHIHALAGGITQLECDLSTAHSWNSYERLVLEYSQQSKTDWVLGSGWFGDAFPGGLPHKDVLDRIVGDRPVALTSHDSHGLWVNSAALRLAGIDHSTGNPPAGIIVRDHNGEATGVLFDAAAELVTRHLPAHDEKQLERAIIAAQKHLFSLGITAWHDAIIGEYLTFPDSMLPYAAVAQRGELRGRVTGAIWWPPEADIDYLDTALQRISIAKANGLQFTSVKIMQDGICENHTAAMLEPYSDSDESGSSVFSPSMLNRIVASLDENGVGVHFHAVGDRAVRECLDAVEHARAQNGAGTVHQIAHLDVVNPADFGRFHSLNVIANVQPLWARNDQEILQRKYPLIGEHRTQHHFPFGSLHRSGAQLAMGSDWPVTSPNPLWGLYTACMRMAPRGDIHALNPQSHESAQPAERLPLETALHAYTVGSAASSGLSRVIGSLDPGKKADLVILDGPITSPSDLEELTVAATVLDGEFVFHA